MNNRLASQHLLAPALDTPVDVVRTLGAVQAQDYAGAKWAVAQRTRTTVSKSVVEAALTRGEILRTHVLRPTWHFVTGDDIRWMLMLTAPRIQKIMNYYGSQLGLDAEVFRRSNNAIVRALRDGAQLTRAELAAVLRKAGVNTEGSLRLTRLVMHAELDALICSGGRRGKQFTYALLDERAPHARTLSRDEALHQLAQRYFATRSPATAADFAWWSGLTVGDATKAIQMAELRPEPTTLDGRRYWSDPSARAAPKVKSPFAHLLPNYDEYFIGYKDRSAIGQRLNSTKLVTGGNALIGNVLLVNGQLVGSWRRTLGQKIVIEIRPLTALTRSERRAIHVAVKAYGKFAELPVSLRTI